MRYTIMRATGWTTETRVGASVAWVPALSIAENAARDQDHAGPFFVREAIPGVFFLMTGHQPEAVFAGVMIYEDLTAASDKEEGGS